MCTFGSVFKEKAKENPARLRSNRGGRCEFIASVEKEVDRITVAENGGSYDAIFCIRGEDEVGGGRGEGGWGRLQMWQLWWKERGTTGDKRWRGEVVEDGALFIPADTSESLIHLKKGISQVTTHLTAVAQVPARTARDTRWTRVIANHWRGA